MVDHRLCDFVTRQRRQGSRLSKVGPRKLSCPESVAIVCDTGVVLVVVSVLFTILSFTVFSCDDEIPYKSSISSSSHLLNFLDRCGLFQSLGLRQTRRPPYFSGKYSRYQPFACPNHHLPVVMENFFKRRWIRMTRRWRPIGVIQSFRCAKNLKHILRDSLSTWVMIRRRPCRRSGLG